MGVKIKLRITFSTEMEETRKQWNGTFKVFQEDNYLLGILQISKTILHK